MVAKNDPADLPRVHEVSPHVVIRKFPANSEAMCGTVEPGVVGPIGEQQAEHYTDDGCDGNDARLDCQLLIVEHQLNPAIVEQLVVLPLWMFRKPLGIQRIARSSADTTQPGNSSP